MLEIREVKNKWQLYQFVKFGNDLYKDCENQCPHLILDEMGTLNPKKNPAAKVCEQILLLAYRDGKIVGRIAGIINHAANERWNVKKVRFGWMDFIDDQEVSHALLDAVAAWGKQKGMDVLNGPVGFTDQDFEGLLIEGFEYMSPMISLYNYPYYQEHMLAYGLEKETDWIEFEILPPADGKMPEKLARVAKIAEERSHIRIDKVKNTKELIAKYGYEYMDVLDEAYQKLYNYQPLTQEQKINLAKSYFPLLNFDFISIAVNEKNEIVGVAVVMPEIAPALRKCHGRLFPFGWYHIIKRLKAKQIDSITMLLIAARTDYQGKGVNAVLMADQFPHYIEYGVKRVDTTSMLESNWQIHANFEVFNPRQHKRRRAYKKDI